MTKPKLREAERLNFCDQQGKRHDSLVAVLATRTIADRESGRIKDSVALIRNLHQNLRQILLATPTSLFGIVSAGKVADLRSRTP